MPHAIPGVGGGTRNIHKRTHHDRDGEGTWTKKYMKASGTMTTAKMGVLETITIMVERETKTVPSNMSTVAGSASSIT